MTSSSIWKLNALIKKNLLEMKRNILSTLCEILFPIILMLLLYWLKTAFDISNYIFDDVEGSLENFIDKRSIFNIDNFTSLSSLKWNSMSILPALLICSSKNSKKKVRPKIATVGVNEEIKLKLVQDSYFFKSFTNFTLDSNSFQDFNSENEMNEYIKSNLYGETYPLICFGIVLEEDNKNHIYNYSLHYFENSASDGAQDVPKSSYLIDQFQSGPDMNSYQRYQYSGYPYMMKIISDYILSKEIGYGTKINFGIVPMKYKSYRSDPFGSVVGLLGPFFIIVAYMGHLCIYVYRMVLEKETKVKEGMKIMGLTEGIYFLSYFIQYTVISLVDSAINAGIFLFLFTRIPYLVFFFIFFLFSLNIFALAFFFQSFINKSKESLILSMLLYFVMFFLSFLVVNDDADKKMKIGLSIFPPVTIYLGIILLGKFESHFRTFYLKDVLYTFTNYSVLIMFIMLIGDLLLYLFLGYYLQNILPHDFGVRKPWYFIFTKSFWGCKKKRNILKNPITDNSSDNNELITGNNIAENENFQSEDIYKEMINPKDTLKIRQLVKRFDDGKVAVDHVNLNFYKNEIFALLGHNGAGKTTLISMLTGLYEATEGEAIYDGMNILLPENIEEFREKIGICPQHDVLFNDLNIREHLGMFAIFKGVPSNNVENEVNKIIKDFQLEDVGDKIAKNLSAGQRRKLSIAISLIGGSEVIFLDEPSSGMDITSRRNLWEILKRQSDNKIIILTTHYMEEASVLGKRIGIINLGKMKCIGTPLFLIEKFGKYMNITLVKEEDAINEDIIHFFNNNVKDGQFESLSEEIMVRIPKNNFGKDGVSLNDFFENLDENLNELKIKSYSVSMPTLEDVFLNVAADDDNGRLSLQLELQKKNDMTLFNLNYLDDFKNRSKFISDFCANFTRRFYLTIRDKKGILMEVICPILLVLIGSLISQVQFYFPTPIFETKDISSIGKQTIYFADMNNDSRIEDYYINDYKNVTSKYLTKYNDYLDIINNNKTLAIQNFINCIYNETINSESTSDNDIDMNSEDYVGYYGNFLLLNEPNENNTNYEFVELVNSRVIHGVPIYTSAFLEQIINKASSSLGHKVTINYKHKVMPNTAKQDMSTNTSGTVVLFVAIAFSLIPANFITIIVKEKNNNSKHLMRLSGMNILSYWMVNFLFELFKYYFTGGICMAILYAFDYYTDYLIYFYLLYGPPLILMTYVVSFVFKDESGAQNKMILIHSLIGALGSSVILVLRGIEKTEKVGKILEYIFCLLPSFSFSFAYNLSNNPLTIYMMDFPKEWMHFDGTEMIKEFKLLLCPLIYLSGEIGLYGIILILIEVFSYCNICTSNESAPLTNNVIKRDSGVIKEELRAQKNIKNVDIQNYSEKETNIENNKLDYDKPIQTDSQEAPPPTNQEQLIDTNSKNQEENFIVRVKGLRKIYQTSIYKLFCCCCKNKGKPALKNLNFCLEKGECFGLLGLNGAGKTTTFKCITQEISPTNGEIFLNGKKSNNNFGKIINKFGYCPQYDAIFEYMTVYENLEFYSKLKGVKQECLQSLINAVIYEMRLEEFIKKMAGRLSGGNKRKLSVAISMLCNPPIILLDEPSTGMDPEARRFMWSIIHKMSTMGRKSSVIMTTHSMDEAETLCKRMGIMVNGEFVCLGKANEIKNKYGYGYELNLRIKPMTEEQEEELYFKKYNIDRNMKVNKQNVENVLNQINKSNYLDEIEKGRLGEKLKRDMEKNNGISVNALINWIFYIQNAVKFIEYGRDNFSKIIIEENMDNNFLFKMKKLENENKSIGFLFGLFETHKDECFITEYSIQQTSLEQIFNKFAENQKSMLSERRSTIVEPGDVENISMSLNERKRFLRSEKIVLTDLLADKLLGIDE